MCICRKQLEQNHVHFNLQLSVFDLGFGAVDKRNSRKDVSYLSVFLLLE